MSDKPKKPRQGEAYRLEDRSPERSMDPENQTTSNLEALVGELSGSIKDLSATLGGRVGTSAAPGVNPQQPRGGFCLALDPANTFVRPGEAPPRFGSFDTRWATSGAVEQSLDALLTKARVDGGVDSYKYYFAEELESRYLFSTCLSSYLFDPLAALQRLAVSKQGESKELKEELLPILDSLKACYEGAVEEHDICHQLVFCASGHPTHQDARNFVRDRQIRDRSTFGLASSKVAREVREYKEAIRLETIKASRKAIATAEANRRLAKGKKKNNGKKSKEEAAVDNN